MMKNQKLTDSFIGFTLIACMVVLTLIAVPIEFTYHFNFDESLELTRVHLLSRGYEFFTEVWNDHPLGFPFILNFLSKLFELNLASARYIVLAFSCLNLLIFYCLMRLNRNSITAAAISVLILMTSKSYISYSGALFKEIPSLSLAILSLFLMSLYAHHSNRSRYIYLVLCALSFMISLEIKMAAITLIPTLAVIGISENVNNFNSVFLIRKSKDAFLWIASSISIFTLLSLTILPFSYHHLIGSHSNASEKFAIINPELTVVTLLKSGLENDAAYVLLSLVAIFSILWSNRRLRFLPPLLWLGFNLLRFSLITPVWNTYYLHLLIPAAWVICIFLNDCHLEDLFRKLFGRLIKRETRFSIMPSFALIAQILIAWVILFQIVLSTVEIVTAPNPRRYQNRGLVLRNEASNRYKKSAVENFLEQYRGSDKVILTDNPYFIYRFELDTPPETAILSRKRVVTEGLDGDFILEVIDRRNPDFILLDRFLQDFLSSQALSDYLEKNYLEHKLQNESRRLFILED